MLLYMLIMSLLERRYIRDYERAAQADMEYYADHREEGYMAAHRNRDRVNRRYGRD